MATSTTTKKILTIDDEEAIVELIVDILESNNYQAQSATKWTEAVDALNHYEPDLILLDLKMPTIHGTSMLEFIRGEGFETPVIVVPGFVTDAVTQELYTQGVQGVVKKPFKAKGLIEEIERVFAETAPQSESTTEAASGMDALYNSTPSSPPEPGKAENNPSVDMLYGAPAEDSKPTKEEVTAPENDILQALQKASDDKDQNGSPDTPAGVKPDSPEADLLDALKKREAKEKKPPATPPPVAPPEPEAPPEPIAEKPAPEPKPLPPEVAQPTSHAPPKAAEPTVSAPPGPGQLNQLGAREPDDPFKQQRGRRGHGSMRQSSGGSKDKLVMGGITLVCLLIAGFLAIMQYLASEAPTYVEKLKSEANQTIRSQVNKQVQKAQQQQMIQQIQTQKK